MLQEYNNIGFSPLSHMNGPTINLIDMIQYYVKGEKNTTLLY